MKTVIDAVNELKGDINNIYGGHIGTMYINASYDKKHLSASNGHPEIICTISDFNKCVEEMTNMNIKPVYTQAMVDAGEPPNVGMEVMHLSVKKVVMLLADSNSKYVLKSVNDFYSLALAHDIKPLTPPIELIDGERYNFVHGKYGGSLGVYNSADEKFYNWDLWVVAAHCTNIKLLTIKGEL